MLITMMTVPVIAATTQDVTASVTVSSVINATITDNPGTGLNFGSLSKGATDTPETAQTESVGAVTIVVHSDTSVNCNIKVKATDFTATSPVATLPITNAKYGTSNSGTKTAFAAANTYYTLGSHTVGASDTTVQAYHWLSIPSNQVAGSYQSTFTYTVE